VGGTVAALSTISQKLAYAAIDKQREAAFKFGATLRALRALRRARLDFEAGTWAAVWAAELGGDDAAAQTLLNIIDKVRERHFVTDEVVMREGELATHIYIVTRGRLQVERRGVGRVARLSAGDTFGEGGLLEGARRMATVRAERGAGLLELNAQQANTILRQLPRLRSELTALYRGRFAGQLIPPSSPLAGLHPDQLDQLFEQLRPRRAKHGEALLRQDRVVSQMGLLLSGVADVWRARPDGSDETLARLVPGQLFGVHSLLTGAPSRVTVEAVGSVQYYTLDAGPCADLLDAWPLQRARLEAAVHDRWSTRPATAPLVDLLDDAELGTSLQVMCCPYCDYEQVDGVRCMNCGTQMPWVA
jgi:CRP-like cAMP-binding protein